jgi:hypothetical protein
MNNAKREKFIELANKRVNKAINAVRLVGNLSNKSNYEYSSEDIKKVFDALDTELKKCRSLFEKNGRKENKPFRLE